MTGRPEAEHEVARWLREAQEELRVARHLWEAEELPARAACFHAHLAAEKALKALVLRTGSAIPRVHDLVALERMLPADFRSLVDPDDLDLLNPWAMQGRYPADLAQVAEKRIADIVKAAGRVVAAAESAF
ncbi:MAG TPA: HEPN domain-containing protein [Acidimicrobiales bacterium]|nr:HEPN domain-containing protein [Acidimicrobiales bacterium]